MSKHTPGPWLANIVSVDAGGIRIRQSGYRGGQCMASMEREEEQRIANANLIAAAPDMLDALEDVQKWADPMDMPPMTMALVREAIAKAKGETA